MKYAVLALPLLYVALVAPEVKSNGADVHFSTLSLELDGTVSYRLTDDLLQPQLLRLVQDHPKLKKTDQIIWGVTGDDISVRDEMVYRGITIDHVINNIAAEYGLLVFFYQTGGVVIVNKNNEGSAK